MNVKPTFIPGVCTIKLNRLDDDRGFFLKNFHGSSFAEHGLRTDFVESYITSSRKNIVRGMHFQRPPHSHAKLVTLISGEMVDVLLDIRKESPTFGKSIAMSVSESEPMAIYIPEGVAHGFLSLKDDTRILYMVTAEYAPGADLGIHWKSFGYTWPVQDATVSARDEALPEYASFRSPF